MVESEKTVTVEHQVIPSYIIYLLTWEQTVVSAACLVAINCVFWVIVSWNRRFFSIVSIFALVLFGYRTWVNEIWPEIRVPPSESEDTESWTALNPGVLSVPELSRYLTELCDKMLILFKDVWKLREENRGLFCALMCGFLSLLALIGRVIPGVLIVYSLVLLLSLGPGVALHLIPSTIYDQMIGYFAESEDQASTGTSKCGTSDRDSDIEEFVPEASDEVLRQLSLKDDVPEMPSPGMPLTESEDLQHKISEFGEDSYMNESDELALYQGLGAFPSVEEEGESEVEDEISDSILPSIEPEKEEMRFNTSHFKEDSSESESDAVFTEGLSFTKPSDQGPGVKEDSTAIAKNDQKGGASSNVAKRKISSSSDLDDELMDFEILEESDIIS